jgi:hypothetical protein
MPNITGLRNSDRGGFLNNNMIKPTDIRVGNLIQYDHDERRQPPVCMMRGWVKEIHEDGVLFTNGEKRKWERTAGLGITNEMLINIGFTLKKYAKDRGLNSDTYGVYEKGLLSWDDLNKHWWVCGKITVAQPLFFHHLQNLYQYLHGEELSFTLPEATPPQ